MKQSTKKGFDEPSPKWLHAEYRCSSDLFSVNVKNNIISSVLKIPLYHPPGKQHKFPLGRKQGWVTLQMIFTINWTGSIIIQRDIVRHTYIYGRTFKENAYHTLATGSIFFNWKDVLLMLVWRIEDGEGGKVNNFRFSDAFNQFADQKYLLSTSFRRSPCNSMTIEIM